MHVNTKNINSVILSSILLLFRLVAVFGMNLGTDSGNYHQFTGYRHNIYRIYSVMLCKLLYFTPTKPTLC